MARKARVESVEVLKAFKMALGKFVELADVSLNDADSDMVRTLTWLEGEQRTYWRDQLGKRAEEVSQAQDALRQKRLFKDASGRPPNPVEEEKALALAKRRLEEAQQKVKSVHKAVQRLQREIQTYKGLVQRFATDLRGDIPVAGAHLDKLTASLEAYVALAPATVEVPEGAEAPAAWTEAESLPSMARPEPVANAEQKPTQQEAKRPGPPGSAEQGGSGSDKADGGTK